MNRKQELLKEIKELENDGLTADRWYDSLTSELKGIEETEKSFEALLELAFEECNIDEHAIINHLLNVKLRGKKIDNGFKW